MPPSYADPFERFAECCALHLCAEPVPTAPRDVAMPIEEADQSFVVTISKPGGSSGSVRLVYFVPLASPMVPGFRDVLWWLAGDAMLLERADGNLERWARAQAFPVNP